VFGANATPHFVKGIAKEPFPTPFGPSPVVNVVAGMGDVPAGRGTGLLGTSIGTQRSDVSGAMGVLLMGLFPASIGAFGKRA
jgi:hypothetical protein